MLHLGDACTDKHPEGPLHFHTAQVILEEPRENGQSTRSTGSPEEEAGMFLYFLIQIMTAELDLPFVSLRSTNERCAAIYYER